MIWLESAFYDVFSSIISGTLIATMVGTIVFIWGCERDRTASKKCRLVRTSETTGERAKHGTMESYGKTGT